VNSFAVRPNPYAWVEIGLSTESEKIERKSAARSAALFRLKLVADIGTQFWIFEVHLLNLLLT
jgi:hypothetical protein